MARSQSLYTPLDPRISLPWSPPWSLSWYIPWSIPFALLALGILAAGALAGVTVLAGPGGAGAGTVWPTRVSGAFIDACGEGRVPPSVRYVPSEVPRTPPHPWYWRLRCVCAT